MDTAYRYLTRSSPAGFIAVLRRKENGNLGSSRAAIPIRSEQLCRRDANYGARLRARIYLAKNISKLIRGFICVQIALAIYRIVSGHFIRYLLTSWYIAVRCLRLRGNNDVSGGMTRSGREIKR